MRIVVGVIEEREKRKNRTAVKEEVLRGEVDL